MRCHLLALLFVFLLPLTGCWQQFEDPEPAVEDGEGSGDEGSDDDDAGDDDDATSDDDDPTSDDDDDATGDDDDATGDDDDATDVQDDDDTPFGDDDDSAGDDDDSAGDDDDSAGDDDDSAGDDDDSAGDDDDSAGDDDDSAGDDDDATGPTPCGVTPVTMDVQVELLDPAGNPTTEFSTSSPLTIEVSVANLGTTPEVQWYGSSCLYQHFLWDASGNTVAPPRPCNSQFQQFTFECTAGPTLDSDPVVAWWTDLDGFPTSIPLPPGNYTLDVDTYYYGVFTFAVTVVP